MLVVVLALESLHVVEQVGDALRRLARLRRNRWLVDGRSQICRRMLDRSVEQVWSVGLRLDERQSWLDVHGHWSLVLSCE